MTYVKGEGRVTICIHVCEAGDARFLPISSFLHEHLRADPRNSYKLPYEIMAETTNETPAAVAPAAEPAPAPAPSLKEFTMEDVAPHNTAEDCWMVIRDEGIRKVYDVTAFLDDHPGGPEIMVDVAGQDATDEFEDIGHSNDARAQLKEYEIGKIKGDVKQEASAKGADKWSGSKSSASGRQDISGQNGPLYAVLAAVVAIAALYLKYQ
ncbi:hypothetical protein JM18_008594 [Phytophthora kernoviae]|uniref:Cytochrome b5 heme-binding domain-containing protein n=2 Tax=Phytophthora kernoviae TaxID=325452 RepID=A0A921SAZ1_9STRA|nr:hypothetical protein G195_007657 [Phytophthora kernoviae 00238/432]KAG2512368.1 hypothetical protein JM18_008594 [Phytophthora kernoviae]